MYVTHNVVSVRPFGGVEVYVDELVRRLPEQYEPFLYYADRRYPLGKVMVCENVSTGEKTRKVLGGPIDEGALQDTERELLFGEILHDRRIDIVHQRRHAVAVDDKVSRRPTRGGYASQKKFVVLSPRSRS